jgi:hypothetical protein
MAATFSSRVRSRRTRLKADATPRAGRFGEVVGADDDSGVVSVAGDDHAFAVVFNAVDDFGEVVADRAERLIGRL